MFKKTQITKVQLRFIMLKGLHLLAAIFIICMLVFYFNIKYQTNELPDNNTGVSNKQFDSPYEQFCTNSKDINCGSIENFITKSYSEDTYGKIILTEDVKKQEAISKFVENNSSVDVYLEDMNKSLDKLYEEKLPDDIIDINMHAKIEKSKDVQIIPSRKPPYFGKEKAIVIVIDDMGISLKRTAEISSLKAPITSSFLTYGDRLEEQIQKSLNNGHEIIAHVPMEAKTSIDVAPDVLTTQMSHKELRVNLSEMLKKFKGIKGINNHMGSKLTEDYDRMKIVMEILKEEGLYFLDSKTSPNSRAEDAAIDVGIAYAHRHVFLDNNNDKAYILGQLAKAEKLAHKNGYAIAIGHPKSQTYLALKEWLTKAEKKGIKIIPLSEAIAVLHPSFRSAK